MVFGGAFLLASGLTMPAMAFIKTFSPVVFGELLLASSGGCEILWMHKTEQHIDRNFFIVSDSLTKIENTSCFCKKQRGKERALRKTY